VSTALWLFALQATFGAFDTLYFHEWKARLPARGLQARPELDLHAARDFVYALLFATLPRFAWHGLWAWALFALVAAEIAITLRDFVVEDRVRAPQGGVFPGERVTHALMAIVYGAALAHLLPEVWRWTALPTGFAALDADVPGALRTLLSFMALGVLASGVRDVAATRIAGARWPWPLEAR
jgi:hypothetical protein